MKAVHATTIQKTMQGWKIIFPILALFLCLSCNKDDDEDPAPVVTPPAANFLKATVGGTEYTFNHFFVDTETVLDPGGNYVDLHVTATIVGDASKSIEFKLQQDTLGTDTMYYFYMMTAEGDFDNDHTAAMFNTNVTTNANRRIIGTFSGDLKNFDETETVTITNGSFDITY